jgi:hypothetical protein
MNVVEVNTRSIMSWTSRLDKLSKLPEQVEILNRNCQIQKEAIASLQKTMLNVNESLRTFTSALVTKSDMKLIPIHNRDPCSQDRPGKERDPRRVASGNHPYRSRHQRYLPHHYNTTMFCEQYLVQDKSCAVNNVWLKTSYEQC